MSWILHTVTVLASLVLLKSGGGQMLCNLFLLFIMLMFMFSYIWCLGMFLLFCMHLYSLVSVCLHTFSTLESCHTKSRSNSSCQWDMKVDRCHRLTSFRLCYLFSSRLGIFCIVQIIEYFCYYKVQGSNMVTFCTTHTEQ